MSPSPWVCSTFSAGWEVPRGQFHPPLPPSALWTWHHRTEHSISCIILHLSDTLLILNFLSTCQRSLYIWNKYWHASIKTRISHISLMCTTNVGKPQNHKKDNNSWPFYQIVKNPTVETLFYLRTVEWFADKMLWGRSRHTCLRGTRWYDGDLFLYWVQTWVSRS